jgi:hypothetical protein
MIIDRVEHPGWLSERLLPRGTTPEGTAYSSTPTATFELRHERIRNDKIEITRILVTHCYDHVVDIADLAKRFDVPLVGSGWTKNFGIPIDETIEDSAVQSRNLCAGHRWPRHERRRLPDRSRATWHHA